METVDIPIFKAKYILFVEQLLIEHLEEVSQVFATLVDDICNNYYFMI